MKKNAPVNDRSSLAVEKFVVAAVPLVKRATDNALALGKLVDELVTQVGTEYGQHTIDKAAADDRLACSAQWLRRCWAVYRLTNKFGVELKTKYPRLSKSHLYQIARILAADLKPTEDQTVKQQQEKWIHAFATEATRRSLTVDELRKLVSNVVGTFSKKPTASQHDDTQQSSDELTAEALDNATHEISRVAAPAAITSGKVTLTEARTVVVRVLDQVVTAAEQLIGHGQDGIMADHLKSVAARLTAIAAKLAEINTNANIAPAA